MKLFKLIASKSGQVVFDDVWFRYDTTPADMWVLKRIQLDARPGQTIALVGHTGSGKTSIISLIARFYEPQRGRILVNGVDIRELPVDVLRAVIGYVQQDIFLFAGDVAGNLRLDADIDDASIVVNDFASFLQQHPHITRICFNGAKAESSWRKQVQPVLVTPLELLRLPSTSPAHAGMPYETKRAIWVDALAQQALAQRDRRSK